MFADEFKSRYTTIPFAIYKAYCSYESKKVLSHQHREIELIAMTEGEADFYIDTQLYKLNKGDILIIPPYSIHRVETASDTVTSYDCICFDLSLIWDAEIKIGLSSHTLSINPLIKKDCPFSEQIKKLISDGCCACSKGGAGWELEAIGSMSLIFGLLKRNGCFFSKLKNENENTFAQKVMDHISNNYAMQLSSTDIAVSFYMNNSYFCRLFKKTFGCCFSDYVLTYRLEKAKIYLNTTSLGITDIAFCCGFNSCSYFGKAFRERFGTSPLAYRKNCTN